MDWSSLAGWWLDELAGDPTYAEEVLPLAIELLDPRAEGMYLDVGCGEGRMMKAIVDRGAEAIGVDAAEELLARASEYGEVHLADVPPLDFFADAVVDGVVVVLVLEHIRDEEEMFAEAARVTKAGGVLALVINHPVWTAPGSTPIQDPGGELLWRPGEYFSVGWADEPAGEGTVRFHHRPLSRLLTAASDAGWSLERMVEHGVTDDQVQRVPGLAGQEHIPRLLGGRWRRR
jgi:SAM-dependent methyltransferase